MSSWSEDYDAECRMLLEAARALHGVDPNNGWLQYLVLEKEEIYWDGVRERLWPPGREYRTGSTDTLRLLAMYRVRLEDELHELQQRL